MAGIVSYGIYIPIYRLSGQVLRQVWGEGGKGEKAVANFDEDSLTIGVEAGRNCLKGMDKGTVDALYFASTTSPFKEKQAASIMTPALDLREDIVTADFANSLRSGTMAFKMALDTVKAGSARTVLVVASDCRIPPPNSASEPVLGDGAAAFLVGGDEVVAEVEGSNNFTSEFIDTWRLEDDKIIKTWEDRFIREEGYVPHLQKAISKLLENFKLTSKDIAKAAFNAPDARLHRAMARTLGLDARTQLQDPLFDRVGNTGAAFALMILAGALEEARPGERILLANYGDGADAYLLRVTEGIKALGDRGVSRQLESKLMLDNYGKYVKFKGLMEFEQTPEFRQRTSLPLLWRDRQWVYRFHGHKCKKCGKEQFPIQRFCMYCQASSEFLEEIPLSDRRGTLFTYSMDERAQVTDPPNVLAAVDLGGGARFYSQMTDRDTENLKAGMPMEVTFRRIHDALGVHNYFWKCKPARE